MDKTPNLSLPYIMSHQAQKHVTHNEALRMLDAIVHLSVASRSGLVPPSAPAEGDRHIVAMGASGEWAGWDLSVAIHEDGAWSRVTPQIGWRAWVEDEATLCVFDGGVWIPLTTGGDATFDSVGINTPADAINRLAVSSPATLLNHAGGGHQVKVNKSAAGATASFLFQTGFSGRAEIGTTGDDHFHFKVSSDGATWREAMTIHGGDGKVAVGESFMRFSALNVKGRSLTGTGTGWFGMTVTNTDADLTNKGGAVLTGAPFANVNKPFMVLGPWATTSAHIIYYGGGGWGVPDATEHQFFAGTHSPALDNGGTLAFAIGNGAVVAHRNLRPSSDNAFSLGIAAQRWSVVHAVTGTINTSDARLKTDIAPVPLGLDFVRDLEPVSYRWTIGGHEIVRERVMDPAPKDDEATEITIDVPVSRPGARRHYGLLAQQVKAAVDAHGVGDFAGWTLADKTDADSEQGLRYEQFVPILIRAVQELAIQVDELRAAVR